MKQTAVQVKFDSGRHVALVRYAGKKNVSIENELSETLERLYKRLVPADVREYIEETDTEPKEKSGTKKKDTSLENGQESEAGSFSERPPLPQNGGTT